MIKSTKQKEYAAAVFGEWLTETENNVPFVTAAGYFPVRKAAYQALLNGGAASFVNETYTELYATVSALYATHAFYVPPFFERYGEVEKAFCETQREIFSRYKAELANGASASPEMFQEMFAELEREMR